ncbi:serine/threonine protein kinase [Saccharopolyspora sp. K220]|uniref:serine/threonine-protein kinase n=1 Tax=Saccharopolyspora soli TaxID=2926618 RepID=UPI001F573F81|nr:serine/threonine-protein kinase [Saccharopolyspora soli]MCI2422299.1 serine/threonine protein kinase [Saccharopolyspora soli]
MLTSGQLLADRYRLGQRIAVGGMGEVWQAVDVRLDRTVAIKVLKAELCGDAEFLHRFRTEARTTASLNHPGIAAVHDYGETAAIPDGPEDTAYLVMELVEGEPLAAILAREGRINTDHTLDMLEQAGRALQAAHERGLVHRDVKPGNILITPEGKVKLTDFGIAKAADAAPVTRSGMVMGTAHYIAPEQALGNDATPSSDVYSLAVVGYECLMGHRPFLSENAVTVAMMHIREIAPPLPPDVPPGVRALIEATLAKDPRRRYADGGEFANAVAAVRAGMPLPTPSALVVPPQRQLNVSVSSTGVHQMPGQLPPMSNTYPPGLIPPQAPAPQLPPQPSMGPRNNKVIIWVLLAVLAVALLVVIALTTYWVVNRDQGLGESGLAPTQNLDSAAALRQTSLRHAPMIGASLAGWPDTAVGGIPHVAPQAPTERGESA